MHLFPSWQWMRLTPFFAGQAMRERSSPMANITGYIVLGVRAATAIFAAIMAYKSIVAILTLMEVEA